MAKIKTDKANKKGFFVTVGVAALIAVVAVISVGMAKLFTKTPEPQPGPGPDVPPVVQEVTFEQKQDEVARTVFGSQGEIELKGSCYDGVCYDAEGNEVSKLVLTARTENNGVVDHKISSISVPATEETKGMNVKEATEYVYDCLRDENMNYAVNKNEMSPTLRSALKNDSNTIDDENWEKYQVLCKNLANYEYDSTEKTIIVTDFYTEDLDARGNGQFVLNADSYGADGTYEESVKFTDSYDRGGEGYTLSNEILGGEEYDFEMTGGTWKSIKINKDGTQITEEYNNLKR